ncbi:MAG: ferrochelatase [Oligoflexia bacterium]|nr:ferrochelatase [Oligoflexia bacterium]
MRKRALFLCNMGTPDKPTPPKVREYLREFLMDPYVVDLAWPLRFALVHGVILPRRAHASAEAYRQIWTERGSPLLVHLQALSSQVEAALAPEGWLVRPVMRYGNPSIDSAVEGLRGEGVDEIVFFPLYPQFSAATTESSVREFTRSVRRRMPQVQVRIVPPFYDSGLFLDSFAEVARARLREGAGFDHVLFSFHGLPERQIRKADKVGHCLSSGSGAGPEVAEERYPCCGDREAARRGCYRAQCLWTARALGQRLGLASDGMTVSFQSRLGRTRWIGPYTDRILGELARKGVRRLAVLCPAFVADCLETLEEIGMRNRELFREQGGEELVLIPSLNSEASWVRAVIRLATAHADSLS